MNIGIDLRVLQIGHQYRGIGEVAKRTLNGILEYGLTDGNTFVFFRYGKMNDPKDLLEIPHQLDFKEVDLGIHPSNIPSILDRLRSDITRLFYNPVPEADQCDAFIQYDYALGVPTNTRTVLVKHDIIPYVFYRQYFDSPWTHIRMKSPRTTLRIIRDNFTSLHVLRRSLRNADKIICVSEYTRQDIHRHFKIPLNKMSTIHLGVNHKKTKGMVEANRPKLPTKPYLFFIGAIDSHRRRVDDLIAAYNNLRAQDHDIQLVLAGENFASAERIPDRIIREAVLKSSYREDILTLGYIDDKTKQDLYCDAIAFVFPTVYEGFGIPILEAMLHCCPVITYKNSSIPEISGDHVFYAKDWLDIWQNIMQIINMEEIEKKKLMEQARNHARKFTWENTSIKLYQELLATQDQ